MLTLRKKNSNPYIGIHIIIEKLIWSHYLGIHHKKSQKKNK